MGIYLLLTIVPLLLGLWAQFRVKSAFAKWSARANVRGYSGAQAAREMLASAGVTTVNIEEVSGFLSDHYDPTSNALRLSPEVYAGRSVAAIGIACHEAGHALQHAQGYAFLGLRTLLVPTAKIGSWLAVPLVMLGLMLGALGLAKIGVVLFAMIVLFQLITLPVEFNASKRAKLALATSGIAANREEQDGVDEVLDAAAMTYVAATVAALAQLLYFILLISRRRDE